MKPTHTTNKPGTLIALLLSIVILAGCNLPQSGTVQPSEVPTSQPSATSPAPLDTPTLPAPTVTFTPVYTTTPTPGKLVFPAGATAGVVTGSVQPGQMQSYTAGASQNQPMILILESPNNDLSLGVLNPDGSTLLDPAKKWNRWQWLLPKTGTYTIQVVGSGAVAEDYRLTVKIAQLVSFTSGSDNITLTGKTVNGYVFTYAVNCNAQQTMTTNLNVPATTAYLDVVGLASGTMLSASKKQNSFSGVLPDTQDYIIEVIPAAGNEVNYQLYIKCH